MATVSELKIHITTCGIPELEHLLSMLEANIAVLPGVVVKAMQALADSVPAEKEVKINSSINFGAGVTAEEVSRALRAENQRITPIGGR